jgi:predicted DNA-binding transcriptional regulator AlpA
VAAQRKKAKTRKKTKRFLSKGEVLDKIPLSFATIWSMMRKGEFPRPRVTGNGPNGKVMWLEEEIDDWMAGVPMQAYKGDPGYVQVQGRRKGGRAKKVA